MDIISQYNMRPVPCTLVAGTKLGIGSELYIAQYKGITSGMFHTIILPLRINSLTTNNWYTLAPISGLIKAGSILGRNSVINGHTYTLEHTVINTDILISEDYSNNYLENSRLANGSYIFDKQNYIPIGSNFVNIVSCHLFTSNSYEIDEDIETIKSASAFRFYLTSGSIIKEGSTLPTIIEDGIICNNVFLKAGSS